MRALAAGVSSRHAGQQRTTEDQFCDRGSDLTMDHQVGCTYCFIVNATSEWPIRSLSALQSIFASRPAVA